VSEARGLRVDDLKPISIGSGKDQHTIPVTFRASDELVALLEEMTIRLKPRFKTRGDLCRVAVTNMLEALAAEIGDDLTLACIHRERVLAELAFHSENRKWLADTLKSFEAGLWQMLEEGKFQKAHDMLVEFLDAGGEDGTDFSKLFWESARVRGAIGLVAQNLPRISPKLRGPEAPPVQSHMALVS
jgi:hypothetical protein